MRASFLFWLPNQPPIFPFFSHSTGTTKGALYELRQWLSIRECIGSGNLYRRLMTLASWSRAKCEASVAGWWSVQSPKSEYYCQGWYVFFYFYGRVAGFKVASQNVVEKKKRRHFSEPPPSLNFDKSSLRGLKLNCAAAGASSEALILAPPLSTQTALVKQSLKQVFLEITAPVKWLPHPPPPPPNASPLPSHHPHKLPSLFFEGQRGWMDVISFKCSTRSILTARRIFYFFSSNFPTFDFQTDLVTLDFLLRRA